MRHSWVSNVRKPGEVNLERENFGACIAHHFHATTAIACGFSSAMVRCSIASSNASSSLDSSSSSSSPSLADAPSSSSSSDGSSSKSSYRMIRHPGTERWIVVTHWVVYDSDDQAATRTSRDVLVVLELLARNLETVAAWTWVMVYPLLLVPNHVLDLDLIVKCAHSEHRRDVYRNPRWPNGPASSRLESSNERR